MNLTQVSYYARLAIKIFFSLAFIYVLAVIFKNPIRSSIQSILPEKDPPNPVFGQLAPLEFISQPTSGEIELFELNTPNGRLPVDIPKKMTVYKYNPSFLSFEAGKKAQEDATVFGFSPDELITDYKADNYIWRDISFNSMLTIDLLTNATTINTPYAGISSNYKLGSISEEAGLNKAKRILQETGRFTDQLYLQGTQNVVLGRFLGGKVVEATTPLEAQLAQVDFYRKIGDYPILGPDPKKGLIRLVVGTPLTANVKLNNPQGNIYEWSIDTISDASYPIIPVSVAWDNVANGNGVIANVTKGDQSPFDTYERTTIDKVFIDKVYLAYYDNIKPQEFLQPIYVFEGRYSNQVGGKGAISIYYPAIDGSFIKGTEEESPAVPQDTQTSGQTDQQPPVQDPATQQ